MGNVNMEAYQVHFEGKSVAEKLKELDETVKENEQEIDSLSDIVSIKADRIDIAPIFSEESAYSAGDLVYNSNSLWKFSVDHAAGDWDPSEVSAVNIDMELSELKNTINGQLDTISSNITIFRIGRYRLLSLKGCASDTSGNIANLSEQDRPSALNACLSYDNDGNIVCYVTIVTSGVVAARTLAGAILTSNSIYGTISYYV